jgi:hypothetical protein
MYRIWHSEWKIRLPPWARFVPGPYMQNRLGNPGTVMPRWAAGRSPHMAPRSAPSRPVIRIGASMGYTRNPVA